MRFSAKPTYSIQSVLNSPLGGFSEVLFNARGILLNSELKLHSCVSRHSAMFHFPIDSFHYSIYPISSTPLATGRLTLGAIIQFPQFVQSRTNRRTWIMISVVKHNYIDVFLDEAYLFNLCCFFHVLLLTLYVYLPQEGSSSGGVIIRFIRFVQTRS